MNLAVSAGLLAVVLVWAVARPRGWSEAVAAIPAAIVAIAIGGVSWQAARAEAARLWPVLWFLAAVLVLAKLCADEGLFRTCGAWMARAAGRSLLAAVFATASLVTAALSLDATVVLLTPVVFATATRVGANPVPHVYACAHLSNTASLLLPVSNLTNLLAFTATGLSFARFTGLMFLPWLVAIAVEYLIFRRFFAAELREFRERAAESDQDVPVFALLTVGGTLAAFVVTSAIGIDPAWAATAGAMTLAVRALLRRHTTVPALFGAMSLPFLAFVLALGIVVRAVVDNGLGTALAHLIPTDTGLPSLLAIAFLAAALANLINNLPAVLVLTPLAAVLGPPALLAVLLGVNLGPNLTYPGSLATLLWRRVVHTHGTTIQLGDFTRLGLLTVPTTLAASVVALWCGLQLI